MSNKNWEYYRRNIYPVVKEMQEKKGVKLWYEVWIDLSEQFDDKMWPTIKDLPVEAAAKYVLNWLVEQEHFYDSPHYIEMLNGQLSQADFA